MIKGSVFLSLLIGLALPLWTGCSLDAQGKRVVGGPGFGNASIYSKAPLAVGINNRSDAITKYLSGKDLASIEGVWVWDNNQYEAAIIRNTTDPSRPIPSRILQPRFSIARSRP